MESLHAPWRIEYSLAKKAAKVGRLFSRSAQEGEDEANFVIARARTCFALLNTYPYTGGHLMVVPYKQVQDLNGLTDEEMADLMKLTRSCQNALTRVMKPHGFNIGINLGKVAGAGILEHLHVHIVPRWEGDTNFMPVLANTSVVPQALKELAAQLREALLEERIGGGKPDTPEETPHFENTPLAHQLYNKDTRNTPASPQHLGVEA